MQSTALAMFRLSTAHPRSCSSLQLGPRVMCPLAGVVGARNAKWLTKIITSAQESDSFWQQRDYKAFSPGVNWDNVDWSAAPPIQEMPVTSATCEPPAGTEVSKSDGEVSGARQDWSAGFGEGAMWEGDMLGVFISVGGICLCVPRWSMLLVLKLCCHQGSLSRSPPSKLC